MWPGVSILSLCDDFLHKPVESQVTRCYTIAKPQLTRKYFAPELEQHCNGGGMERGETIAQDADQCTMIAARSYGVAACAGEVMSKWTEQLIRGIPAVGAGATPALAAFLPVLFDNIAEAVTPDGGRPLGTDRARLLSESLTTDGVSPAANTDNVVKELQTFRSVIFSVVKSRAIPLSDCQYQRMGDLIDLAIRQAINVCTERDRELRETVISELSHDLRNPLNIASALSQLIQRRPDNEKVAMMATRIYEKIAETDAVIQAHVDTLARKQSADAS
jgi:signal transduction histidine kinase